MKICLAYPEISAKNKQKDDQNVNNAKSLSVLKLSFNDRHTVFYCFILTIDFYDIVIRIRNNIIIIKGKDMLQ